MSACFVFGAAISTAHPVSGHLQMGLCTTATRRQEQHVREKSRVYRMSHLLLHLGWVDFYLDAP